MMCRSTSKYLCESQCSFSLITAGFVKRVTPEFSPFQFLPEVLYQERQVRYNPTLYRPGTKLLGEIGKEKTPG